MSLCWHELRWLRAENDPLAPKVLAMMWAIADTDPDVVALVKKAGARPPEVTMTPQDLVETVPAEMAAAAAGLLPDARAGYAGQARYEAALSGVKEPLMRAEIQLEGAIELLRRYGSGWYPERLDSVAALVTDAANIYRGETHRRERANALLLGAVVEEARQDPDRARKLREAALHALTDADGRFVDRKLANQVQALITEADLR